MITVCLIEDDQDFKNRLETFLSHNGQFACLSSHCDAEEALTRIPHLNPDVVVIDLELPGQSGIEAIWELKSLPRSPSILVLTRFEDGQRIFQSIRAGASGYILKRASFEQVIEAIQEIHHGGSPMTPQIARKVLDAFREQSAPTQSATEKLTSREEEVLQLARGGLRYKEIAAALGISNDTVRTHFQNIYKKLHVRSRSQALSEFYRKPSDQTR